MSENTEILGVEKIGQDNSVVQLITTNPNLNYHIVGLPNKSNCDTIQQDDKDWIDKSMVDYNFPIPNQVLKKWLEVNKSRNLNQELDIEQYKKKGLPLSFLEIKCVEEGTNWYLQNRQDLPKGLAPLLSRYMFGDLKKYNRQQLRLLRRQREKKKKKKKEGLKIDKGQYTINFA